MDEKIKVTPEELFSAAEEEFARGKSVVFTVSGSSMLPLISGGRDKVRIEACGPGELRRLDIVAVKTDSGRYLLHRIVKKTPDGIVTCGDWNEKTDGFFRPEQVVAKAVSVIRKGRKISCDSFFLRAAFWLWVLFFPLRRQEKALCGFIAKIRHKK